MSELTDDDLSEFEEPAQTHKRVLGKVADLLERNGIDVADIGKIHRVNVWQGFYKGAGEDGEPVDKVVDLAGIQLSPHWAEGPHWPVVQQAPPCVVRHTRRPVERSGERVTVLLPDPQIGFLRLSDGELVPMHDERAIACALEVVAAARPDCLVWLGDTLDFAEWSSKFLVLPEFVMTTQPTIDYGHRFLADSIAAAGAQCEDRRLLEGNHDNRLGISIARNAIAAMRLRQANAPADWPVMSVPHLLRLDELGVKYVDGYPAGRTKLASAHGSQTALYALHGEKLSMEKQARAERVSTVQGHAHHVAVSCETYDGGDGQALEVESWSLGCLCRRDGVVPSTKGGHQTRGRHVERIESWQHAVGVLTETDDGWWLEPVRIREGRALWRGKVYSAGF